jgi:hypothetical protein
MLAHAVLDAEDNKQQEKPATLCDGTHGSEEESAGFWKTCEDAIAKTQPSCSNTVFAWRAIVSTHEPQTLLAGWGYLHRELERGDDMPIGA